MVGTAKIAVKGVGNVLGQKIVNTSMEHACMAAKVDTKVLIAKKVLFFVMVLKTKTKTNVSTIK